MRTKSARRRSPVSHGRSRPLLRGGGAWRARGGARSGAPMSPSGTSAGSASRTAADHGSDCRKRPSSSRAMAAHGLKLGNATRADAGSRAACARRGGRRRSHGASLGLLSAPRRRPAACAAPAPARRDDAQPARAQCKWRKGTPAAEGSATSARLAQIVDGSAKGPPAPRFFSHAVARCPSATCRRCPDNSSASYAEDATPLLVGACLPLVDQVEVLTSSSGHTAVRAVARPQTGTLRVRA